MSISIMMDAYPTLDVDEIPRQACIPARDASSREVTSASITAGDASGRDTVTVRERPLGAGAYRKLSPRTPINPAKDKAAVTKITEKEEYL